MSLRTCLAARRQFLSRFEKAIRLTDMGAVEADEFERQRSHLFALAYRMLGSASEAEDVVQDGWLRSSTAEAVDVRSPRAYLMTVVTRLALDRLKSARARRQQYIGPCRPEPVLTDGRLAPEESVALAESLTLAFMVLLETLSPEERAVFVLREVLEYSYAEIASVLNGTEANCRQLFHRAKERLRSGQSRSPRSRVQKRELAERFVTAMRAGDGDELTRVLAADVGFWGDGRRTGRCRAASGPRQRPGPTSAARHSDLGSGARLREGLEQSPARRGQLRPGDAGLRGRPPRLRLRLFDRGRRNHRHSGRP